MKIITTISEMRSLAESLRRQGRTIGFVPTMGFLHEGHLSLIRKAREENDIVVVSIFVNPTQFGPREDLDRYPRDEEGDRRKCESADVDVLFLPTVAEMYPGPPSVFVSVEGIGDRLEGAIRPGHFRGVATVVAKLFHIVAPRRTYFGQKDYQQCVVLRRMVAGLDLNVELIMLPTVREPDGLAMSSRNSYLASDERQAATVLSRALAEAERFIRAGAREPEKVQNKVQAILREVAGLTIDYVEVADPESLAPVESLSGPVVILIAVRLGRTRLIDNILIS